ncbi:MAG: hypothetical protein AAFX50_11240, partial [Acidobacteriota bacterium]
RELCARVRSGERTYTAPCLAYDVRPRSALYREISRLGRSAGGRLEAIGRATDAGFPLLAGYLRLMEVHRLRQGGGPDDLETAHRWLRDDPPWLRAPAAADLAGNVSYQLALLALEEGRVLDARRQLLAAERRLGLVASPILLAIASKRAALLSQLGAGREASRTLRDALRYWAPRSAPPSLVASARETLAWVVAGDPLAGEEELGAAASALEDLLGGPAGAADPRERANTWLNLADLRARLGQDAGPALAEARHLLDRAPAAESRTLDLAEWAERLEGLGELEAGDPAGALARCRPAARARRAPLVAAATAACAGRALRRLGDPDAALRSFEHALSTLEAAAWSAADPWVHPGPGLRAEVTYRAARAAVDAGREDRAWDLLGELDAVAALEAERRRCLAAWPPGDLERRRRYRAEGEALLAELVALDGPSPRGRAERRAERAKELRHELRRHRRELPGCRNPGPPDADLRPSSDADLRAFTVDDETILLGRGAGGRVELVRRSRLPASSVREVGVWIERELAGGGASDAEWRRRLRPLAEALAPGSSPPADGALTYALHGVLQGVPVAALPLDGDRWLADLHTVALRPAGARRLAGPSPSTPPSPLFVVDPNRNLPAGPKSRSLYRRLFPRSP